MASVFLYNDNITKLNYAVKIYEISLFDDILIDKI